MITEYLNLGLSSQGIAGRYVLIIGYGDCKFGVLRNSEFGQCAQVYFQAIKIKNKNKNKLKLKGYLNFEFEN